MNLNKVQVYGRLTADPELKALPNSTNVVSFSIATNYRYKDRDGKQIDKPEYHNVVFFNKAADVIKQYVHKGDTFYVEGRLQTRNWEKDGQKHYRTEIIGEKFEFGDGNKKQESTQSSPAQQSAPSYPEEEISPEDIPF